MDRSNQFSREKEEASCFAKEKLSFHKSMTQKAILLSELWGPELGDYEPSAGFLLWEPRHNIWTKSLAGAT